MYKKRKETNKIVIHCSDTYEHMDIGAKEIDLWHKQRGWTGIGYHYVITRDGRIEFGRPHDTVGAHVKGHNDDSVAVCLVGGKGEDDGSEDNFTFAQKYALKELLDFMNNVYEHLDIYPHNELDSNKACPCFDIDEVIALV